MARSEPQMMMVRDLVGFVKWDGDEYHDFRYYSPSALSCRRPDLLDFMAKQGYHEVFVERQCRFRGKDSR